MKFLMFILRFVFGLTFILSGFFKLVDPVGTGLIVKEYLNAMHMRFLYFGAVPFGISLSILEFIVGVAVFMRMRMKLASLIGMVMTGFFTVVTLLLVIFNPIKDCGCFGEAIHLTNWQTFIKNLILLVCIVPVFMYRKKFRKVAPIPAEWVFIGFYGLFAVSVSLYSLIRIPFIEFGDFKVGANIAVQLDDVRDMKFETVFIYEKDGKQNEFSLDNLPDSTWTFVDSKDVSNTDGNKPAFDFSVTDASGEYITDNIVYNSRPIMLCVISDMDKFDFEKRWNNILNVADSVKKYGGEMYICTSSTPENAEGKMAPLDVVYSDYKTLISLNRSNGGFVYLYDGIVVRKWSKRTLNAAQAADNISKDPDVVMSGDVIKRQLTYEISIVLIFLSIVLMRYICGIIYGRRQNFFD